MNDTRKDGRLAVSLVARYREPSMLELREGECQDLSLNGMFIQTPKPSPRGALIRFECDAGRTENNFRGTGRVVWQRRKPDSRGPAGMGVRFVRLESGDHDALERIIAQLNATASGSSPAPAAPGAPVTKLAATLRGQPLVLDPRVPPASGRPEAPANVTLTDGRDPVPSSVRPPMPTLLEVPRHVLESLPGAGSANAAGGDKTLLGVAAPIPSNSGRPDPGGPAVASERPQPQGQERGNATVIGAGIPRAGDLKGTIPSDRKSNDGRGHRNGKKKNRGRRSEPGPSTQAKRAMQEEPTIADPNARAHAHAQAEVPREIEEPYRPEYGGRRLRPGADDYDGRPESEPPRATSGTVMWLVLGTGLIVSWGLVTLFGTVPVGVPDKIEEAHEKSGASTPTAETSGTPTTSTPASNPPPAPEAARRYALLVETRPPGARITVAGQSVVSPARVELDAIQPPLVIGAELAGYKTATVNVWPSEFTLKAGRLEYRLVLEMQTAPPAQPPPPPPPVAHETTHPTGPRTTQQTPQKATQKAETQTPPGPNDGASTPTPEASAEGSPGAAPQAPAAHAGGGGGALAQALECLGRGDNRCVIRALENRATSAREIELLIETYRAMGTTPKAEREMKRYLDSYPNGKRAPEYRRLLERRGAKTP